MSIEQSIRTLEAVSASFNVRVDIVTFPNREGEAVWYVSALKNTSKSHDLAKALTETIEFLYKERGLIL